MPKKICIVTVGKVKEKYLQEGILEYRKRLKPYCDLEVLHIKDSEIKNESLQISQMIDANTYILDEKGACIDSIEFSKLVQKNDNLKFIIGGPDGILPDVKKSAKTISLSKMTFTHEMCALFLLEQVYRAFMILNNRKYHR
jgi:23S rRNA (pseudouridine1915-N3)-methyltransferase